jgi:FMN reductase
MTNVHELNGGRSFRVVAVSGSPAETSSTAELVDYVLARLPANVSVASHIRLRNLDPRALLSGDCSDERVVAAQRDIDDADGVIIATPVFKAAYSGLLKAFLDVLPQFGLAGKAVLPLATGGSLAHVLALDYALRPVLQSMGARHIVQSHFVSSSQITREGGIWRLSPEADGPLGEAVFHFGIAIGCPIAAPLLGHPRPARAA